MKMNFSQLMSSSSPQRQTYFRDLYTFAKANVIDHQARLLLRLKIGLRFLERKRLVAALLLYDCPKELMGEVREKFGLALMVLITQVQAMSKLLDGNHAPSKCGEVLNRQTLEVIQVSLANRLVIFEAHDFFKDKEVIFAQTKIVYIPIARCQGYHLLAEALEHALLSHADPLGYKMVEQKYQTKMIKESGGFRHFVKQLEAALLHEKLFKFQLQNRQKSVYSVYQKMQKIGASFEEIYDYFGMRIILENTIENEIERCFEVGKCLTKTFDCDHGRTRDWLLKPRASGYQALHLSLMGAHGSWVEVQVRTARMHQVATTGRAAHWRYKQEGHLSF